MNNYKFDWDPVKADSNWRKHGISFATAVQVFGDDDAVHEMERVVDGEQRWQVIGRIAGFTVLLVAYFSEDMDDGLEYVRIISARRAERWERKKYEESYRKAHR